MSNNNTMNGQRINMSASLGNIKEELEEEFEGIILPIQAPYSRDCLLPPPSPVPNTTSKAQTRPSPPKAPAAPLRALKAPKNNKNCQIHLPTYGRLFGFLLFGAGIAVSHHFFYQSLNGQPVSDLTLGVPGFGGRGPLAGFRIDRQQLYLQIGTLMAWIAQGCFAATINAAYNQYAWTIMRAWSSSKQRGAAVRARTLECMFSGSSDLMAFLDPRFIRAAPMSWFIAGFIWLMPLTGLFTQATLNVAQSVDAVSTTLAKGPTTASKTATTKYAYKQKTLALSYGISFSFALVWALVGLICLVKNRGVGYGMRSFSSILATAWRSELHQGMDELSKAEQGMRQDVREHVSEGVGSMFGEDWNHQGLLRNGNRRKGGKNSPRTRNPSILAMTLESEVDQGMDQLSKNIRQEISRDMDSIFGVEGRHQQVKNGHGRQRRVSQHSQNSSILAATLESEVKHGMNQLGRAEQDIRQDVSEDLENMFGVEDRNHQVKSGNARKGRNSQRSQSSSNFTTTTWESEVQEELNRLSKHEQDILQGVHRGVSEDLESMFEAECWNPQVENEHGRRERQNPTVDEHESELD